MVVMLLELDLEYVDIYKVNVEKFVVWIYEFEEMFSVDFKVVYDVKFVVFYDVYYYFEYYFDVEVSGVILINLEVFVSVECLVEIQGWICDQEIICVFQELQFDFKFVVVVIEGSDVKVGMLDLFGMELGNGFNFYLELFSLILVLFVDCLSEFF